MNNLLFRRQFVFCPVEIDNRPGWNFHKVGNNYFLYSHPDLVCTEVKEGKKQIIVLGDLYYPLDYKSSNYDIVCRLIKCNTIHELTSRASDYAGRFAIIFDFDNHVYLFNDASASRKIYFTFQNDHIWCASQPHVIAEYCDINETNNPEIQKFYKSKEFIEHNHCGVLDKTFYDPVKQLLPNRYIDVNQKKIERFWPVKKNKQISLHEGVEVGTRLLSGIIKSANERNDLMMAITAGNDTRLLLAASREVSENIYYYTINIPRYSGTNPDLTIPHQMLNNVGLNHHILEISYDIDKEFKTYYFRNNQFALERNLPVIYSIFHKQFPDKINLPGRFSDISRRFFNTYREKLTPELLAKFWYYNDVEYVINNYRTWLTEAEKIKHKYNYNILELLNWEERNGNLYTQFQVDKDIAQEEFTPYNCRKLMEVFLAVPLKYRDIHTNIYFRKMVKHLWPEVSSQPFNPYFEKKMSNTLKKVGLYWYIRRITRRW